MPDNIIDLRREDLAKLRCQRLFWAIEANGSTCHVVSWNIQDQTRLEIAAISYTDRVVDPQLMSVRRPIA